MGKQFQVIMHNDYQLHPWFAAVKILCECNLITLTVNRPPFECLMLTAILEKVMLALAALKPSQHIT